MKRGEGRGEERRGEVIYPSGLAIGTKWISTVSRREVTDSSAPYKFAN